MAEDGGWHSGAMTDIAQSDLPARDPANDRVAALVEEWWDWSRCAAELGITVSKVRQLIREHQLAAVVPGGPGTGQRVPAGFVQDGAIVKGVPGVLTVLHDGGYDDRESITWLYTDDPSLPGRPIDALRENRGSEVRRRAQAMAF